MNNYKIKYFENKKNKLNKKLKIASEEHRTVSASVDLVLKNDFRSRFEQFINSVQKAVYHEQATYKYWDNFKKAFCFDRWNSLASILPLLLLLLSGYTEGLSLVAYLCLVFAEFWNCQNESVNQVKKQLIDLDEKNIFKGLLYFHRSNGRIFKGIFSPVLSKKQYQYTAVSGLPLKTDVLYATFMRDENNFLFLYNLDDNKLLLADRQHEHFRVYSIFWENCLANFINQQKTFLINYKQLKAMVVQRDLLETQMKTLSTQLDSLPEVLQTWQNYILSESLFMDIMAMLERFEWAESSPRGMLLYGPPGTGKSLLVRNIAKTLHCNFYPLSLPDIKSDKVGGSAKRIRQIWDIAKINAPSIIFIDECEGALKSRGHSSADCSTEEIIQAILAEWDGICSDDNIWLIGATNRPELIDKAALSRFEQEIEMPFPDTEQLYRIFQTELNKHSIPYDYKNSPASCFKHCSGRDITNLVKILKGKSEHNPITHDLIVDELTKIKQKNKIPDKQNRKYI